MKAAPFPDESERLQHTADYWLGVAGNFRQERDDALAEVARLQAALDIARTALLRVERLSEEGRAALSKVIVA